MRYLIQVLRTRDWAVHYSQPFISFYGSFWWVLPWPRASEERCKVERGSSRGDKLEVEGSVEFSRSSNRIVLSISAAGKFVQCRRRVAFTFSQKCGRPFFSSAMFSQKCGRPHLSSPMLSQKFGRPFLSCPMLSQKCGRPFLSSPMLHGWHRQLRHTGRSRIRRTQRKEEEEEGSEVGKGPRAENGLELEGDLEFGVSSADEPRSGRARSLCASSGRG